MKFRPINDCVYIQLVSKEKSEGGILYPETSKKTNKGKVLGVGPGKWDGQVLRSSQVKVNDIVLFEDYGMREVEGLHIIREESILGVLEKEV